MKSKLIIILIILNITLLTYGQNIENLSITYGANGEIILVVDSQLHIDYGLVYPMTYEITIPNSSSSLSAYYKYTKNSEWNNLLEKTSNDFFNGIEAVRFDYTNSKVYVSVAFASESDSLLIFITDNDWNSIRTSYKKICKYYDNRVAAVTATADDLAPWYFDDFVLAFNAFRERELWLSCGVITEWGYAEETWDSIQAQLDLGFIEVLSHSRKHEWPYSNIQNEVGGSKQDIIEKLDLPPLFKSANREYVYAYVYPYGRYNNEIDEVAANNKYLICRTVEKDEYEYSSWNSELNIFNRVGEVLELGKYAWTNLNTLNNSFDRIVNINGIYHMIMHPAYDTDWANSLEEYIYDHLDYISHRKNLWYVSFGHLYLYNLLRVNDVKPISALVDLKLYLEGPYNSSQTMNNTIPSLFNFPLSQPYIGSPWNYAGDESISSLPSYAVDWVLVELRDKDDLSLVISSRAALLLTNGSIVDLDGSSHLRFSVSENDYYVVVYHRNHLPVMSAAPIKFQ
jgi:peptidoglycan/xylan/chitin deacetylase (PgdA/CDA1 family)